MSPQPASDNYGAEPWRNWPEGPLMLDSRLRMLLDNSRIVDGGCFVPGGELFESRDRYLLDIDLPGVLKEDVVVRVNGCHVGVSGRRRESMCDGIVRRRTRSTGAFSYQLTLDNAVQESEVAARLQGGVLQISLPKVLRATGTRVAVD